MTLYRIQQIILFQRRRVISLGSIKSEVFNCGSTSIAYQQRHGIFRGLVRGLEQISHELVGCPFISAISVVQDQGKMRKLATLKIILST